MTDRESHELAAKAAGYTLTWKECHCKGGKVEAPFIGDQPWQPKEDDGDAFRLAMALKMTVCSRNKTVTTPYGQTGLGIFCWGEFSIHGTANEAIFAAAVAVGKAML